MYPSDWIEKKLPKFWAPITGDARREPGGAGNGLPNTSATGGTGTRNRG